MSKVRFGDVASRLNIKVDQANTDLEYYIGGEHIESSEFMIHDRAPIKGSTIGYQFQFGFRKRDILFMTKNPHLRKTSMVDFDGLCSIATFVIHTNDESVLMQDYLLIEMQTDRFWDYCETHKSGGVNYFINWGTLANYEFELPPIEEQRQLSEKLWSAYRLKESYRRLLKATDEMVKSRFIEMFGNPISSEQNYPLKKLGECAEINPRRDTISLSDSDLVSFVPMPSVNEEGYLQNVADVAYGSVKKGFTYFKSGDILFAKITPCMENGKGAIAENLTNNIGMGSTEVHVLRPIPNVSIDYWVLALTRLPVFREKAAKNMTGTGGQKRVPSSFLSEFKVGLPPISAQEEFATVFKQADKSKFNDFKSRFIVWSSEWNIHMTIRDLVDISVEKAGRRFKPQDTIRYIDISSVDGESNSVIGTTEYKFSEAPSRAQQCTKKGDILVSTVRPNLKNIAVNQLGDDNLVASTGFCVLRPKEKCSGLILAYVLSEPFTQKMVEEAKGSNYPAIHDSDILDYPITVPESNEMARVGAFVQQTDKSKYLS